MASQPIFSATDIETFKARRHIQPANGRRHRVSSSIMNSEVSESSSSSDDSAVDISEYFTIPKFLVSQECLEYLGWGLEKAEELWQSWLEIKEAETTDIKDTIFEANFLEHATDPIPISEFENTPEEWVQHMQSWGVAGELIEKIMAAEHTPTRMTESAQYWVRDTMQIRYLRLEDIRKNGASEDARTRRGGSGVDVGTTTATTMSTVSGYTSVYKAISSARLGFDEDGRILFDSLESSAKTDLRSASGAFYFAVDIDVAKNYARYIRSRCYQNPVIVRLRIPNSFVEGLPPYILNFGDFWKEVIHTCRSGRKLRGAKSRIRAIPLIIAPIATGTSQCISALRSWEELSYRNVMQVNGAEAIQWCFQGDITLKLDEVSEVKVVDI